MKHLNEIEVQGIVTWNHLQEEFLCMDDPEDEGLTVDPDKDEKPDERG